MVCLECLCCSLALKLLPATMLTYFFVILSVILYISRAHSQSLVDQVCTLESTGQPGECKLLNDCEKAFKELRNSQIFPQTCGFQGKTPVVCCEKHRQPGETSKKKCEEYSAYVLEKKRPPTLLIDEEEVEKNECGHKVVKLIIGGERATRNEFPHMAVVGFEPKPRDIKWLCGGTIISPNFILTAGHCLVSTDFGPAKYVRLGVTNLNDQSGYRQEIRIAERIPYKDYKSSSHYHDIALLRLERPAKMSPFARPACLNVNYNFEAKKAIATGWGNTAYGGISSDDLLKVTLNLFDHTYCNQSYKNQISRKLNKGIVDEMQICAGSEEDEEKDTCQGDSGGPLQIYHIGDDIKCMYDIIGITSFGKACTGSPGVYIRVSNYIQWIEDIVWP